MTKLRRLFSRARPEAQEINILRGILTSVEKMNKKLTESILLQGINT